MALRALHASLLSSRRVDDDILDTSRSMVSAAEPAEPLVAPEEDEPPPPMTERSNSIVGDTAPSPVNVDVSSAVSR